MRHCFISYADADVDTSEAIALSLEGRGLATWLRGRNATVGGTAGPTGPIVQELADVFCDTDRALLLAREARFPLSRLPAFGTPLNFWSSVVHEANAGVLPNGARSLIEAAARLYPSNASFARHLRAIDHVQNIQAVHGSSAMVLVLSPSALECDHITREVEAATDRGIHPYVFRTSRIEPVGNLARLLALASWHEGFVAAGPRIQEFTDRIVTELSSEQESPSAIEQERLHGLVRDLNAENPRHSDSPHWLHAILAQARTDVIRELALLARRQGQDDLIRCIANLDRASRSGRWPASVPRLALQVDHRTEETWFRLDISLEGRHEAHDIRVRSSGTFQVRTEHDATFELDVSRSSFHVSIQGGAKSPLRARRISIWNGIRLIQQRLAAKSTGALGSDPPDAHTILLLEETMELHS